MEDSETLPGARHRNAHALSTGGLALARALMLILLTGGCTPLKQWMHHGFKVGPEFEPPPAATATHWIDAADPRVVHRPVFDDAWWHVFRDPTLNALIDTAYRQNLDLKTVGTRVLQAQAQRNISAGNLFPQRQTAIAYYAHAQISRTLNLFNNPQAQLPHTLNVWPVGFNASWELDFWGRLRRSIESSNADRDASVEAYHDALVTLSADVATNYVQIRTAQRRIALVRHNVDIQRGSLRLAEARLAAGKATALDVEQAKSSLAQTESTLPPLMVALRQANDRLCILLGQPPQDLATKLRRADIPATPVEAAVGIPAQLLERRPDVRGALREAAAQSARIGMAEADFYPQIGVTGFMGYVSSDIRRLFEQRSFTALVLPTFSWQILNYGRVLNNVRHEDARFRETVFQYQQTVLQAGSEVEDALVGFLQYQLQARSLADAVRQAEDSVALVQAQYEAGLVDFNRVFTSQSQLVTQQDALATARGNIASALIAVYRSLGGGWQVFDGAR